MKPYSGGIEYKGISVRPRLLSSSLYVVRQTDRYLSSIMRRSDRMINAFRRSFRVPFVTFVSQVNDGERFRVQVSFIRLFFCVFDRFVVFYAIVKSKIMGLFGVRVGAVRIMFIGGLDCNGNYDARLL